VTSPALKALAHQQFNYAPTKNDVWNPARFHVGGLHEPVIATVLDGLAAAERSTDGSPIGVAIQGQRGAGKTHLLSHVRELTQLRGGYFFLVNLLDANSFWRSVSASFLDGLNREVDGGGTQLDRFLRCLTDMVDLPFATKLALTGRGPVTMECLDEFSAGLRGLNRHLAIESRDTARALVLLASSDRRAPDIAMSYLIGADEAEPGERARWGIRSAPRLPQELVSDMSRLLALTGPSVVAIDQVDGLIAQVAGRNEGGGADGWRDAVLLDQVAGGLMELREMTSRTLTVLALLPVSWTLIRTNAVDTVQDRFREVSPLESIPSAEVGRAVVQRRLSAHYEEIGFEPPYPTWPVRPEAFDDAADFTPRQLLINVERHIRSCLIGAEAREMFSLSAVEESPGVFPADRSALGDLDDRYATLKQQAATAGLLRPAVADTRIPALLAAGLDAWIREGGGSDFEQDSVATKKPALHARLRRILDDRTGDEEHWAFLALAEQHYNAELSRLRNACVAAGLAQGVARRKLFILRNEAWSNTPQRRKAVQEFVAAGGRTLPVGDDDLRSLVALRTLLAEEPAGLQGWLADRRPAAHIALLASALATAGRDGLPGAPQAPAEQDERHGGQQRPHRGDARLAPAEQDEVPSEPLESVDSRGLGTGIRLGSDFDGGTPLVVELAALRKHVAIFAGSGSGKTVFIRRLVEECARRGVSAIVLDPNKDLARLSDPWPAPPDAWSDGDAAAAADYLDAADVVLWTPGRAGGRPLTFQPLPDFRGVRDDPDEFSQAVDVAVDALAHRGQVSASTAKALRGQAVLRQTLWHYGRHCEESTLGGLIDLLRDLPMEVSDLAGATTIAADLAENLEAARINDPLFGGAGQPADPGLLLQPAPGKRARISIISFVGLPSEDKRQSFVNQLQMALFSWIKRNPAGDRPLGGLLVMDEAQMLAPSGMMTACTRSTLMLASQARKYGLGLVFATQAPKGVHSQIPGNAATQVFGLLNAPVHIEAAREMARFKGGDVPDISRLTAGQFYLALEGEVFRKARTPLCLSHHPSSPLSAEDVVLRARHGRQG